MSLSLRKYAEHRRAAGLPGTTHQAVRAAIAAGRLVQAVTPDGRIADPDVADREWAAATLADRVPSTGPTAPGAAAPATAAPSRLAQLREQRAELAIQRERFELDRLLGKYVLADEIRQEIGGNYTLVRNRLLGIPSQVAQRLDRDIARKVYAIVDDLIRQCLENIVADLETKGDRARLVIAADTPRSAEPPP